MAPSLDDRRQVGRRGEDLAATHLESLGYEVLQRSFRVPGGEVDIVAREGDTVVFVEVRSRRGKAKGSPEESITTQKQSRLVEVALCYLQRHGLQDSPWRIDVVAVDFGPRGQPVRMEVLPNAVEEPLGS